MMAGFLAFAGAGVPGLAFLLFFPEWLLLGGAAATVVGTIAQWQFPRWRMSAEEAVKDGKLSEMEARRRIGFHRWLGPSLIVVGGSLMLWSVSTLM